MKYTVLLACYASASVLGAIFLPSMAVAEGVVVRVKAFDEKGRRLPASAMVSRMTNGAGEDFLSDGNFDLDTLRAVALNSHFVEDDGVSAFYLESLDRYPNQGIMVHWNTRNTGYSSFLMDNGGRGFSESTTIVLNERLALDAARHLQQSIDRRAHFEFSADFERQRKVAAECISRLGSLEGEPERGRQGQECLDRIAVVMQALLREFGVARARELGSEAKWGVTIRPDTEIPLSKEYAKFDDLADLFAPQHRWARIVMDGTETGSYMRIGDMVRYSKRHQIKTMGQLFDSTSQKDIPLRIFKQRVDRALAYAPFKRFDAWEVGNEVNGGWLGQGMTEKIEYASRKVKERFPGKYVCLTFYWYGMQDSMESSLFNWIDSHVTPSIVENIDCVTSSVYVDQQPLGFLWDMVQDRLARIFPGKDVLVGEMGFLDPTVRGIYREGPEDLSDLDGGLRFVDSRYPSAFATENATGGGFWWYYDAEMVGKKPLWRGLRDTYCSVYPEAC